jgi:uncharacterized protein with beta-barrel porin domain
MSPRTFTGGSASGWRTWFAREGTRLTVPGRTDVGSVASEQQGYSLNGGVDFLARRNLLVGAAAGAGHHNFAAALGNTRGSARSHHVAAYAAWAGDAFYASGSLAFARVRNQTSRLAEIPATTLPAEAGSLRLGGAESLGAEFTSWSIGGAVETGYMKSFGWLTVTPFAGLQVLSLQADEYAESGSSEESLLGLKFEARQATSMPAFLGLQLRVSAPMSRSVRVSAFARAAWRHELQSSRAITGGFIAAPGATFIVRGAELVPDATRASLGAQLAIGRMSIFGEANGDFSRTGAVYAGAWGLRVRW